MDSIQAKIDEVMVEMIEPRPISLTEESNRDLPPILAGSAPEDATRRAETFFLSVILIFQCWVARRPNPTPSGPTTRT